MAQLSGFENIAREAVRQPPRPGQAPLAEGKQVGGKPTPECRLALLGARASRRDPLEANYVTAERTHDAVYGPPLTPEEAVASIARRVRGSEAQGFDREQAILRTNIDTGIDPEKVRWCVETVFGASPVRLSPAMRRRRSALAIVAAL